MPDPDQCDFDPGLAEGHVDEVADHRRPAGGEDIVVGLGLLEDAPHALDVILGVAPVPLGVEVAEVELFLQAVPDARGGPGDFARHEGLAPHRRLVVEEDAVAGVDAVGFAIVHRDPVGVELGRRVGTARVEGRGLLLRRLPHLAVELRGGGLVDARLLLEAEDADGLEETQRAEPVGVGRVLGRLEETAT